MMDNRSIGFMKSVEDLLRLVVFKIFKKRLPDRVWESLMQFVSFSLVGVSNTLIGYLIYAVSLKCLRKWAIWPQVDIYLAQCIMFLLSVAWSFYWNNKMVFKQGEGEGRNIFHALMKTYASYAFTGLFLAEIMLHFWVNVLGISEYIAPMINLIVTVPLNFLIQKFWTFKKGN